MIGVQTSIADRQLQVTLQNPGGPAIPDGDGGSTPATPVDLIPATVFAAGRSPTAADLERLAGGTVIASASRVLTFPFHPQVTTQTRVSWTDAAGRAHAANVTGVDTPGDRCVETVVLCVEIVP